MTRSPSAGVIEKSAQSATLSGIALLADSRRALMSFGPRQVEVHAARDRARVAGRPDRLHEVRVGRLPQDRDLLEHVEGVDDVVIRHGPIVS